MEPKITYIEYDISEKILDFLKKPSSIEKNIQYEYEINKMNTSFPKKVVYENDEKFFYLSCVVRLVKFGSSYFLKETQKKGFSYNKKSKKLKLWFGTNLGERAFIKPFLSHINANWFDDILIQFLTKGGLEKIIQGKITNPIDYCKYYLRANKFKDASPKLFYRSLMNGGMNKHDLFRIGKVCKNINNFFIKFTCPTKTKGRTNLLVETGEITDDLDNGFIEATGTVGVRGGTGSTVDSFDMNDYPPHDMNILLDTAKQAEILNEKIDINWSGKRLKDEHKKFTKIIMDAQVKYMEDFIIPYDETEDIFVKLLAEEEGFELLDSKKKVFKEGKIMNHCIFTNYWDSIFKKTYVCFHIKYGKEEATFGSSFFFPSPNINEDSSVVVKQISGAFQLYGYANETPSREMRKFVTIKLKDTTNKLKNGGNYTLSDFIPRENILDEIVDRV